MNNSQFPTPAPGSLQMNTESTDEVVISKSLEGIITSWNPAAERLFGYNAKEIVGRSVICLFPEERAKEEEEILNRIKKGECVGRFDTVRVRKDGTLINVRLTVAPLCNEKAEVIAATKIVYSVPDWAGNLERLQILDACISRLDEVIMITAAGGFEEPEPRIVFASQALERTFGYQPDEVLGKSPRFLQGTKTDPKIISEIKKALEEELPVTKQLIVYDKMGREHWTELHVVPVFGADGRCRFYASIQQDISESKRALEKISEQAALLNETRDAIMLFDLEGKIIFWNPGAESIYGWTAEEAIGCMARDLNFRDAREFDTAHEIALEKGRWCSELKMVHKLGRELVVEAHWSLIRDHSGEPKSILRICYDITDRKKGEAVFLRSQRMESIGTLAGGMAHDLNNILSPILMSIDLLRGMTHKREADSILDTIDLCAQRGAGIVKQVLSFAKGVEGDRIEIELDNLIKDMKTIVGQTFPKNIQWQIAIPRETRKILADPTQIQQVLINLCVNARDAMPKGGVLKIALEDKEIDETYVGMALDARPGSFVVISVADEGQGISKEDQARIFEPFFTTKEIGRGSGLGLSTALAIVRGHKGFITLYSEPGKGSIFRIYLPAEPGVSRTTMSKPAANFSRGRGETVLLVEDEDSVFAITSRILESFDYHVLGARNGAQAVAVYSENRGAISAIIMDMMMPIMDGPAAISAILALNPHARIIASSGLGLYDGLGKPEMAAVKHFLDKPYTAATLLKTLNQVLSQ